MNKELRDGLEKRAQARRDFMQWARIQIVESVIDHGFKELYGVLERILHVHRQMEKEHPVPEEG